MILLLQEKTEDDFMQAISQLRTQFIEGSGKAGYALSLYIDPENEVIPLPWRRRIAATCAERNAVMKKTFELLQREAESGDGEAMHLIAHYYQTGMPPVQKNLTQFQSWCEKAVKSGYLFAANDLHSLHGEDPNSLNYNKDKAHYYSTITEQAGIRVVPPAKNHD